MKKRKVLSIVLSIVLCFAVGVSFTACGSGSDSGDDKTLTLWIHNDEDSWTQSFNDVVAGYMEANPDVTINIESFPYDEYESKVQTALMSKEGGADIYELWGGWGVDFAPAGVLEAMPEAMQEEILGDAYPATYGALVSDDVLYGMPLEFNIECGGLIVNNNVMKAAGVTVPTTWDELVAAAEKGTTKKGNKVQIKGFDFVNWDGVMYLWTSMILSQGDNYLNEDGTINVTSDAAKKAWEELAGLVTDKQVTTLSGLDDGSDIEGYQELYTGEAMMVPRGPWCLAEGQNDFGLKYGKDYSYTAMPFYGSEEKFAAETGWSMAVGTGLSEEKKAIAFDFLEYMFSDEVAMSHNLACGTIPAKKSVAQDPEYVKQFPYAEPLVGILEGSQFIGEFNTDVFKEQVNETFSAYCKGKAGTTDEALAKLEKTLNNKLFK
ncbi:MAG: extracellular solute-binding protein [Firmicutes bacterium]|nr:extracellular solute-binding protein [Bacillota bacterium]